MVELLILRLIHIGCGMFWVGAGLFTALFLSPTLQASGPAVAGAIMSGMQQRRLFTVMPVVATLTILSGARLMWIVSAGDPDWFRHASGHTYAVSGALAIIAFLLGLFVGRPAMARAGQLARSAASDGATKDRLAAEIAKLQRRGSLATNVATALVVLATAGMAIARYL